MSSTTHDRERGKEFFLTCFCNLSGLDGKFQELNASLAISICKEWLKNNAAIYHDDGETKQFVESPAPSPLPSAFVKGLQECKWPGRAQSLYLKDQNTHFYLDGAHTEESIVECMLWYNDVLRRQDNRQKRETTILVFNCNTNRSPHKLLGHIARGSDEGFDHVIFSSFATRHVAGTSEEISNKTKWQQSNADIYKQLINESSEQQQLQLQQLQHVQSSRRKEDKEPRIDVAASIPEVFDKIFAIQKDRGAPVHVLMTGSLYLVGGALEVLINKNLVSEDILDI